MHVNPKPFSRKLPGRTRAVDTCCVSNPQTPFGKRFEQQSQMTMKLFREQRGQASLSLFYLELSPFCRVTDAFSLSTWTRIPSHRMFFLEMRLIRLPTRSPDMFDVLLSYHNRVSGTDTDNCPDFLRYSGFVPCIPVAMMSYKDR